MSSKTESGSANNVAKFEQVIAHCTSFGPGYQPTKSTIQLSSMQQLLLDARAQLLMVAERLTTYNTMRNTRMKIFEDLPTLLSRVINALAATDAAEKTVEDARGIARKLKGIRASKKGKATAKTESPATTALKDETTDGADTNPVSDHSNGTTNGTDTLTRTRSSAHTSRDQQIEYFSGLLLLLQSEMAYQPNEPELQVPALQYYLESMRTVHSAMMVLEAELSSARTQRDKVLYGDKTGLCDVARDVKLYVKSAFGLKSPQYKMLTRLRFTRY